MGKSNFISELGEYSWVETDDGTQTLYSHYFNEACHSTGGAYEETLFNYVHGCRILSLNKPQIRVFEVGFGTGLGFICTLDEIKKLSTPPFLDFFSCELDGELVAFSLKKLRLDYIHEEIAGVQTITVKNDQYNLSVFIGDIRKNMPVLIANKILMNIDAIYQDAFSPKRNPTLWTFEWFKELYKIAHDDTILSTYSSTKAVWKALIAASWGVEYVSGFHLKKWSTRAYPHGKTSQEVIELLKRSPMEMLRDKL